MKEITTILIVGIGGYAGKYADALLDYQGSDIEIAGAVDLKPEKYKRYGELIEKQVPIYTDMKDFYQNGKADLTIIASPIQLHREHTLLAFQHGSHVLCEKPICATVQEGIEMIDARNKAGKILSIGYQWSYNDAILSLKKDILDGILGKPIRMKTMLQWPRTFNYYNRNHWAGKKRDDQGNWILDSVANNATAHYLHNMFFVLDGDGEQKVRPANIIAELYRANNIENFDTSAMRIFTNSGVELLFYASHAVEMNRKPFFHFEFEKGTVLYNDETDGQIIALFQDGQRKIYGDPQQDVLNKMWNTINVINGGDAPLCTPEAALSHTIAINGAQESVQEIIQFPKELIRSYKNQDQCEGIYVEGLDKILDECYGAWKLPKELGISWAQQGKRIDLTHYTFFKG